MTGTIPIAGGVAGGLTVDCDAPFILCPSEVLPQLTITQDDGDLGYGTVTVRILNGDGELVEFEDRLFIGDYIARSGVRMSLSEYVSENGEGDRGVSTDVDFRFTDEDDDGFADTLEGSVTVSILRGFDVRNVELAAEFSGSRI